LFGARGILISAAIATRLARERRDSGRSHGAMREYKRLLRGRYARANTDAAAAKSAAADARRFADDSASAAGVATRHDIVIHRRDVSAHPFAPASRARSSEASASRF
jgi:hypothetical protein